MRSELVGVESDSTHVVSCLLCIPMGATTAVDLAQAVSLAIIREAGLEAKEAYAELRDYELGRDALVHIYTDDLNSVATRGKLVNNATKYIS